ncbi:tyrosine recombinase XerC [Weissella halotolerans]|uniref:Tyrosine recombinase XerC n=1 Tax=Weissella halotolerans DSM 20190 TaxID=1123500 RepID=A0A0R2G2C6_9LACO|nr:tyrosine recombinase XerC [Weissella halotolerans]KRN33638.1 integrase recombinase [Weissella halotolerans DSM 20190]
MTSQQLVQLFMDYLRVERQYAEDTQTAYLADIKDFMAFLISTDEAKQVKLTSVDDLTVRVYLSALYDRGISQKTIARKVSALRSFYQFMEANQLVTHNPFNGIHLKKAGRHLPRFFYHEELQALFKAAYEDQSVLGLRNQVLLEFLYGTGARVSEMAELILAEVDQAARIVHITGKGDKTRIVPFGQFAAAALQQYLELSRPQLAKKQAQPGLTLLLNQRGQAMTASGIEYVLKKLGEKAGLTQHISAHMFRHTFASDMLNNGADLRTVQQLLGHSSLSTTQIYTHVTTDKLQQSYRQFFPRASER